MADTVKHEGIVIKMNGTEYIVPPLNFKQLKEHHDNLNTLGNIAPSMETAEMDKVITIILAAINRNYPEITKENLEEWMDLKNVKEIFPAVMGVSGLKPAGEAPPAPAL